MDEKQLLRSLNLIQQLISDLITEVSSDVLQISPETLQHQESKKLDLIVSKYLDDFGIPTHLRGYNYLHYAIIYAYHNYDKNLSINYDIYPEVAKKFDTAPSKVERAIRTAISSGWKLVPYDCQIELFKRLPYSQEKNPTNKQFVSTIVANLKLILG